MDSRRVRNERVAQKGKYKLTISQTNDTKLLYKDELQREKKGKKKRGRENGWESRSERGDPFLGNICGRPSFSFLRVFLFLFGFFYNRFLHYEFRV